jgi:ribosomal protein S3AE
VAKTTTDWKKKRWYRILAPKALNEVEVGETPTLQDQKLIGRTITASLSMVIRDMRKQNINVTFEINKIVGDNALTRIKKYEIIPTAVKRMVRRKRDRIDDSFVCMTSDNLPVRIKPLLLTRTLSKSSQKTALMKMTREHICNNVKNMSSEALFHEVITGRMQKDLRRILAKVFPLKTSEIRKIEVVSPARAKKAKKIEAKEKPKEEKEKPKEEKPAEKKEEAPKEEKKEEPKPKEAPKEEVKEEKPAEKKEEAPKKEKEVKEPSETKKEEVSEKKEVQEKPAEKEKTE